jgi:hypothetical protein
MSEPKIEVSKAFIVSGNLAVFLWIILGLVACWLFSPTAGWGFLIFASFSVYLVLRRLMCNTCYYCKSCTKGFGKLALLFFGKGHILGLGKGAELGYLVFIYGLLSVLPSVLLVFSLNQEFTVVKVLLLAMLLLISLYSGWTRGSRW